MKFSYNINPKFNELTGEIAIYETAKLGGSRIDKRTIEAKDLIKRIEEMENCIGSFYGVPKEMSTLRLKDLNILHAYYENFN